MTKTAAGVMLAAVSICGASMIDWSTIHEPTIVEAGNAELLGLSGGRQIRLPFDGGWMNYADATHTSESPQAISANTSTLFTVDGEGGGTVDTYRRNVGLDVWSGNTLRPRAIGEAYLVRVTMNVAKATSNDTTLELDLGIGAGHSTIIADERKPLIKGQGVTDKLSFVYPIFCMETFGAAGGRFYILPNQDITVWDRAIFIHRLFTPV